MNFKRTAALVASTSLVFGLTGCGHAMGTQVGMSANTANVIRAASAKRANERGGSWTILIHLAAENNLYRFGLDDMNEMEAGLPEGAKDINVYVLFDGIKQGDSAIYHVKHDPAGPKNAAFVSEIVNDNGAVVPASKEIDSGDVNTAAKFIAWAAKNAPADHTYYGVWDHGSGIFGKKPQAATTRGFGWDDNGKHMSTKDMTTLAGTFNQATGKHLDIFAFDACLMAHAELAYQVAGQCDYLAASEQLEPGPGYDYNGWLTQMAALSEKTPANVGKAAVDSYIKSYSPGGNQASGRDDATYSVIDINALTAGFVPALNNFVAAANANMGANKTALQNARRASKVFYNRDCADFGSFLSNLNGVDANTAAAASELKKAYAASVIAEGHTAASNGATGMVLYFPSPSDRYNPQYDDASAIAFGGKTSWKDLLKNYK